MANEEKARLAAAKAEKFIRALCVGGQYDGQWKNIPWPQRYHFDVPRPMNLGRMLKVEMEPDLSVPLPEYDRYRVIGPISMFGQRGISLALDRDTLMDKYHGNEEVMVLKAILQRDVAAEMGL